MCVSPGKDNNTPLLSHLGIMLPLWCCATVWSAGTLMISQDIKWIESRLLKQQISRMPEYDKSHQRVEDKSHKAMN